MRVYRIIFSILLIAVAAAALTAYAPAQTHFKGAGIQTLKPASEAKVLFVGDIMLGRNIEALMEEFGDGYPFEWVSDLFALYDEVSGNLEGPIPRVHEKTPSMSFRFSFRKDVARILREQNVRMVSLANNHTYDFGNEGYVYTRSTLAESAVDSAGHPFSIDTEYVFRKNVRDVPITFASYNATSPHFDCAAAAAALASYPRVSREFRVVNIHWGEEYVRFANLSQRECARALVEAGADTVIGHHPHVVQDIELYRGKLILYSLGNFIFDQYFSSDVEEGLGVGVTVSDDYMTAHLIPFKSSQSQPRPMEEEEKQAFLADLAKRSDQKLADAIMKGFIELSRQ